jgi:hypothetical protein
MKIFSYVVIVLAAVLVVYNIMKVDVSNLLGGESAVALIGVVSGLCAIVLMVIYLLSKKVVDKTK